MSRRKIPIAILICFVLTLTMIVFLPSLSKAENPKIPNQFIGKWIESDSKDPDTLTIKTNSIVWKRTNKYIKGEHNLEYTIADDGKTISFTAENAKKIGSDDKGNDIYYKAEIRFSLICEGDSIVLKYIETTPSPLGGSFRDGVQAGYISSNLIECKFKKATK